MINKEEYLQNPCMKSSLPYWKTKNLKTNKKIVLVDKPLDDSSNEYFFRTIHYLTNVFKPVLNSNYKFENISMKKFVNHINSCYSNIGVSLDELEEYKSHIVYDSTLWVAIVDKNSDLVVATGIAEFDKEINEGILEWVQVSKEYRRCGLGSIIVNELLYRLKDKANFVTVSGDMNNPCNPLKLYLKCGFSKPYIWHIK